MMRIGMLLASRGQGGLEKHVRELSTALVALGHEVTVMADEGFLATLPEGIHCEAVPVHLARYHPYLLYEVLRILNTYRFDIVHAQADKAANILGRLRWLNGSPQIATVHNIKKSYRVYRRFKQVICVSDTLSKALGTESSTVIYNGISPVSTQSLSLHACYDLPLEKPIFCAVGRLVHAKGFDVLLDAIDGLPLSLLIVGEGPLRPMLEKRIAILDKHTNCRLIGHHDEPVALMANADAVIISSRREGFSYVLNEALLSGSRVLSTDVPVANEVLDPALIVPVSSAQALRDRLLSLMHAPHLWTTMMKEAWALARYRMTLDSMVIHTLSAYQRCIEN